MSRGKAVPVHLPAGSKQCCHSRRPQRKQSFPPAAVPPAPQHPQQAAHSTVAEPQHDLDRRTSYSPSVLTPPWAVIPPTARHPIQPDREHFKDGEPAATLGSLHQGLSALAVQNPFLKSNLNPTSSNVGKCCRAAHVQRAQRRLQGGSPLHPIPPQLP